MADDVRSDAAGGPSGRKPWKAPRLLAYGHIGKLTQGSSGTMSDGGTSKKM